MSDEAAHIYLASLCYDGGMGDFRNVALARNRPQMLVPTPVPRQDEISIKEERDMFPWHWWRLKKRAWGIRYCIFCQQRQQAIYNADAGRVQWQEMD